LPASAHEPVLVFHGGGQHVAWQVDEVLGHQEVWVQPAGPQLAQLPGVVGATVLASGLVALLYDPVRVSACYRVVPPTGIEPVFAA
jgi:chemosensory pili system protein ChpA (sensor histidine kinase/response regulator)